MPSWASIPTYTPDLQVSVRLTTNLAETAYLSKEIDFAQNYLGQSNSVYKNLNCEGPTRKIKKPVCSVERGVKHTAARSRDVMRDPL